MSVSISSLAADPRPGRNVYVSGKVTVTGGGDNYSVLRLTGTRVNQLACSDPSSGIFAALVPIDIDLTTSISVQAANDSGTASGSVSVPSGPQLSGATLTANYATNGDGSYTVTVNYSGTWTVDMDFNHRVGFCSPLPSIHGVVGQGQNIDGAEALTRQFHVPAGTSPAGQRVEMVVIDSWGVSHVLACTISAGGA